MRMRVLTVALLHLAVGAMSAMAQTGGRCVVQEGAQLAEPRLIGDLAVFDAPIGHRQPTLKDLPPWLRKLEEPSSYDSGRAESAEQPTGVEQRHRKPKKPWRDDSGQTPAFEPYNGVPQICRGC
jgi:hypothetical protein